ncbi:putative aminoacrylate hydrolase RutD [Janthinobacterium sp. HH103]|uniref:alpha/beta fold hydrolase n=1 Tax=unclassified Janthinobacterium TaxID=2610881 RepID=UPI0008735113|nr:MULTISPECIES: alpha/beta hydrolase [unclassified Janthinobacterium]OEZ64247.1 putative aminoacrylate hydrolase RutD [Janthinobacterium sp. HH100]OEZ68383.1 putative aminoacrylate hydrolase RutD [Janthinobacterium sp. HH103]QOU73409.1 2-succinyl-6-hydroxy-2,4-cyclohexadiene-1-carboxylate synthase [Janthinobacterium sp. HH102]
MSGSPTWVLLRGLMREQRHWGSFPATLARALPGARIVTPDLPGNGTRHDEDSATRVAAMVEDCRQHLLARGIPAPYHLLALSLGGMVAVEWASRYPQEIARCVLVNTSMRPFNPFYRRLRWQNYGALLRQLLAGDARSQEALILRLTSRRHAHGTPALLAEWLSYQQEYPVSRCNALRQLLSAARYRAPAIPPAMPVLVMAGAQDQLVDHRCSQRLARAWQADCLIHGDAGHDLPLDEGEWLAQSVARWLGEEVTDHGRTAQSSCR